MNFTFQQQITAEPMLTYLRALANGQVPDPNLLNELPGEVSALLTRITEQLRRQHATVQRLSTTVASVSTECRVIGDSLRTIGESQARSERESQSSFSKIRAASQSATEQVQLFTSFGGAITSSTGELGSSINRMVQNLSAFERLVEETSSEMLEVVSALTEIHTHAGDLSSRAAESGATVTELGAGTRAVAEQVQEAVRLAAQVRQAATDHTDTGIDLMQSTTKMIESTADESLSAIQELSRQSGAIGKIVTVIEGITKQTNLLALNAAILAAQSGAEGKSFSVVADEIRVLADRTAKSAKEISGVVCSVQEGAHRATDAVERCRHHIEQSSQQSTAATDILRNMVEKSQRAADMVSGIGNAVQEQNKGMQLFLQSMEQMTQMIQFIERISTQHRQVAQHVIQLSDNIRHAARQVGTEGVGHIEASQQIVKSIEPMNERGRAILDVHADAQAQLGKLFSGTDQSMTQLIEMSGRLRQAAATLQTIAVQCGLKPLITTAADGHATPTGRTAP